MRESTKRVGIFYLGMAVSQLSCFFYGASMAETIFILSLMIILFTTIFLIDICSNKIDVNVLLDETGGNQDEE